MELAHVEIHPQNEEFIGKNVVGQNEEFMKQTVVGQDEEGTLTLCPPKNRPRDIPTHTIRPPNIPSTVTLLPLNILLL